MTEDDKFQKDVQIRKTLFSNFLKKNLNRTSF